jgi:hypothetical protein
MKVRMTGKSLFAFFDIASDKDFRPYTKGVIIDHEGNLWVTNGHVIAVIGNMNANHNDGNTKKFSFINLEYIEYIKSLVNGADIIEYDTETRTLNVVSKKLLTDFQEHFYDYDGDYTQFSKYIEQNHENVLSISLISQKITSPKFDTVTKFKGFDYSRGDIPPVANVVHNLTKCNCAVPYDPMVAFDALNIVNTQFTTKAKCVNEYLGVKAENFYDVVNFKRSDDAVNVFVAKVRLD